MYLGLDRAETNCGHTGHLKKNMGLNHIYPISCQVGIEALMQNLGGVWRRLGLKPGGMKGYRLNKELAFSVRRTSSQKNMS